MVKTSINSQKPVPSSENLKHTAVTVQRPLSSLIPVVLAVTLATTPHTIRFPNPSVIDPPSIPIPP